jgi:hypothetical protein
MINIYSTEQIIKIYLLQFQHNDQFSSDPETVEFTTVVSGLIRNLRLPSFNISIQKEIPETQQFAYSPFVAVEHGEPTSDSTVNADRASSSNVTNRKVELFEICLSTVRLDLYRQSEETRNSH